MPRVDPVTIAIFPSSLNGFIRVMSCMLWQQAE
jgi:hypothetical protein